MFIIDYIATGVGLIGVGVIVWGVVLTLFRWVIFEVRSLRADTACRKRESIRIQLGSYLLLGLEFLIAADVIQTVRNPELTEVAVLGSIVAIRTVISFFLNREIESEGV